MVKKETRDTYNMLIQFTTIINTVKLSKITISKLEHHCRRKSKEETKGEDVHACEGQWMWLGRDLNAERVLTIR